MATTSKSTELVGPIPQPDKYELTVRSTPAYAVLLADLGEQWIDEPMPYPEVPHTNILDHLWNLGGEQ